jgi:hypothetical protein
MARQDLLELDKRAHGSLLDAGHGGARGGAEADGDRDRLILVEQERRHRGPGAKPVAAGRAGQRVHGVSELAQPRDVAADRPAGHAQPVRQLRAGPVATRLEQGQKLQEPPRGRRHVGPASRILRPGYDLNGS